MNETFNLAKSLRLWVSGSHYSFVYFTPLNKNGGGRHRNTHIKIGKNPTNGLLHISRCPKKFFMQTVSNIVNRYNLALQYVDSCILNATVVLFLPPNCTAWDALDPHQAIFYRPSSSYISFMDSSPCFRRRLKGVNFTRYQRTVEVNKQTDDLLVLDILCHSNQSKNFENLVVTHHFDLSQSGSRSFVNA